MEHTRSTFSNRLGFVLAAAGSAVGLGNLWRFPYLAAKYGGGIFLLVYIILVVTFGFVLMVSEIAIGRKTGLSPIGAFAKLNKKSRFVGVLACLASFFILPYYSVIGGWVIKYLVSFVSGGGAATATSGYFSGFISGSWQPLLFLLIFLAATFVIVIRGVKRGIEKASRILMPVLVVLSIALAIYSMTLPGGMEGVAYFFLPDFSKFSVNLLLAAMGQMFYSMSLAMGIMITYGSYLSKKENLEKSASHIEMFDLGISILAGLMIIPAVFSFSGGEASAINAGPGLMFETLPKVFHSMPLGDVMGAVFFLLVLFAALTSSISLMEAVVATVCDQFKLSRKKATAIVFCLALILAIPSSLGYGALSGFSIFGMAILDFFDFITNSVLMPICALLTCIVVGYVVKPAAIIEEVELNAKFRRKGLFKVMVKYIAPIFIIAILVSSVLNSLGVIVL